MPAGIADDQIKAWLHGPLSGVVAIPSAQQVTFSVRYLPIGSFFEGRVLMPKEVFKSGAAGTSDRATIKSTEDKYIQDTERERNAGKAMESFLRILIGALLITSLVLTFLSAKRFLTFGKDKTLPQASISGTLWEPPSEIDPAQIEQLINGSQQLSTKSFTATVLSLVQSRLLKFIRSDQKEGFIFKDYRYYLEKVESAESVKVSSIQKYVFDFLK